MQNKEKNQARLLITCALIGALLGAFVNSLYVDFTWKKALFLLVLLYIFEYFLRGDLKRFG